MACTPLEFAGLFTVTLLYASIAVASIYVLYSVIVHKRKNETSIKPFMYHCLLVYFSLIFVTSLALAVHILFKCISDDVSTWAFYCAGAGYVPVMLELIFLLYYRVAVIFHNTPFRLSNCTRKWFYAIYTVLLCGTVGAQVISSVGTLYRTGWGSLLMMLDVAMIVVFIAALYGLFIYKLKTIASADMREDKDQDLLNLIKKSFILTVYCTLSMLLMIAGLVIFVVYGHAEPIIVIISYTLMAADLISDLLAVALALDMFDQYFPVLCPCARMSSKSELDIKRDIDII